MATLTATTTAVPPSADDLEKVNLVRNLFSAARQHRQNRIEWWRRAYRVVHNRTWNPARESWQAAPTASEVYPIIAALVGWMTDQRPQWYITPSYDPGSLYFNQASELARDLEKIIEGAWRANDYVGEIEKMLWDAHIYGTGIIKTGWDASLAGSLGDAYMRRVDPFRFYVDPKACSMEDANYFIQAETMSLQELDRRYPGTGDRVAGASEEISMLDARPEVYVPGRAPMANPGQLFGQPTKWGLPGQNGARASIGQLYDHGVTVFEAWIREHDVSMDEAGNDRVDDRWRVVVVAGNQVLMDEPAEELFGHSQHPFSRHVLTDIGEFWGISLVDHLAPLQISLNRLLAAMQTHAELAGNPIFMEDARSGIVRTKIVNRPGQRLSKGVGAQADWLQPPQMAGEVRELMQFYIAEMERVSGLSAIIRGYQPSGRNAQGVLDSVQESAFVRVRLALRNLERTLQDASWRVASIIAENYTMPRIISITGNENITPIVLKSRHFYLPSPGDATASIPLRFSLWMQAGSAMPTSRHARASEADALFAMGALDPPAVLEAHEWPGRAQIAERIANREAMGVLAPGKRQAARR